MKGCSGGPNMSKTSSGHLLTFLKVHTPENFLLDDGYRYRHLVLF